MFHLALSFGLEKDPVEGMARMVDFVEKVEKKYNVPESVWMTIGVSDGKTLWCFRYASDGKAPTLYYSPKVEELVKVNPEIENRLTSDSRVVVSEPIGKFQKLWTEVPQGSSITIHQGNVEIKPFGPVTG